MTRHRWRALVPYEVTDEDARRLVQGDYPGADLPPEQIAGDESPPLNDERPFLGLHNVVREDAGVFCWACEQPWSEEVAAAPCPGEPEGELTYVGPDGRRVDPHERRAPQGAGGIGHHLGGIGRNDPCPCGSGLKFKRCHGR